MSHLEGKGSKQLLCPNLLEYLPPYIQLMRAGCESPRN